MSVVVGRAITEPSAISSDCPVIPSLKIISLRSVLASACTAGLLWCSFFPLHLGVLAWVALVPLLGLVRAELPWRRRLSFAWLAGLLFFVPVLQWMRVADPMMYATWLVLAVYCSLYFPLCIGLVRQLDRYTRLPLPLTFAVVWVSLEYFRAHFLTGFAWYLLGHTQHHFLPLIQIADLGGAYAVTFVVAAVNAWIFELMMAVAWFRSMLAQPEQPICSRIRLLGIQSLVACTTLVAIFAYGFWRLHQPIGTPGPRIALIQGNLDQRIRNDAASSQQNAVQAAELMIYHYRDLTDRAARLRPDLIVWPETSWPDDWVELAGGTPSADSQTLARDVANRWHTNVLLGLNARIATEDGTTYRTNSALLVKTPGFMGGRYDKIHRVPFGEYVPFKDWLPWMNTFAPYDFDYSIRPGEQLTKFALGTYHFGVLICFEDTDPGLARSYNCSSSNGVDADFLVNISNDGWFDGSSEHDEHLAICRFRAIESRRTVARAVNMGISGVVDSAGQVLQPEVNPPLSDAGKTWTISPSDSEPRDWPESKWQELKKVPAVIIATIPVDHRTSIYALAGDWLPVACGFVLGISLLWSIANHFRLAKRTGIAIRNG